METYGFSEDFLTLFFIHTWSVENSPWTLAMSTVAPQGSILGSLLFNILINNLFYFIKDAQLLNFTDDNTIATCSNSVDNLINDLQKESENAIDWFRSNEMVLNLDKFQSIMISRLGKLKSHKTDSENSLTLLSIEIGNKLNFEKHVITLNALWRIHKYTGFQEMKILLDSFIFSNFSYCLLVWHICSAFLPQKIEKIQQRVLRLLYNDSYSSYSSLLLKAERPTMEVSRLWRLAIEVFKTLKSLNPD